MNGAHPSILVVDGDWAIQQHVMELGAQDLLSKPLKTGEILASVQRALVRAPPAPGTGRLAPRPVQRGEIPG